MRVIAVLALLGCFAAPAVAQQAPAEPPIETSCPLETVDADGVIHLPECRRDATFTIVPDATMSVTLDEQTRVATLRSGPAPDNSGMDKPASKTGETLQQLHGVPVVASAGEVTFTLWSTAAEGTQLAVENKSGRRLIYVAALKKGQHSKFTTICSIDAGKIGIESWTEQVDGIMILRILIPPEKDGVICVDPAKGLDDLSWYRVNQ